MQESSSKDSVSQSHGPAATPVDGLIGSSGIKAATEKKSQLQKALGEFDKNESSASTQKKSLLSDEDNVLQVGNEKRGTIIKDTKSSGWSFTQAVKNSFGGWLKDEKTKVEKTFKKPIPKKVVESSSTRTNVIKKAAQMGAVAGTDSLKRKIIKKPIAKSSHSSIRIKPKDVPKEIGDTKPKWTHIIEDEEETVSQSEPVTVRSDGDISKLIDAPDTHLLLPEHAGVVKPESIKKEYRTPRVSHVVAFGKPGSTKINETKKREVTADAVVPQTRPEDKTEEPIPKNTNPKPAVKEEVKEELTLEPEKNKEDKPLASPDKFSKTPILGGTPVLPTSTIVMVILFIAVISVSTFSWKAIEGRNSEGTEVSGLLTNVNLVQFEKTTDLTIGTSLLGKNIKEAISANSGFTKFETSPKDSLLKIISSWNDYLALGLVSAEIGALNNNPFIAIKTNSKEVGLAAMLSLETSIPTELKSLYTVVEDSRFSSERVNSYDIRVLKNKDSTMLVYLVRSDGLILIAKNEDDLEALIGSTN